LIDIKIFIVIKDMNDQSVIKRETKVAEIKLPGNNKE